MSRKSECCVDPNPFLVEKQDPDNFTRFQTRERCAMEIAAYVFNQCLLIELRPRVEPLSTYYES